MLAVVGNVQGDIMSIRRRAKIIATLGPASATAERIRELALAGADIFRLNFSHGKHEDQKQRFDIIRSLEKDLGRPLGILMDLQGPKFRVGAFAEGKVELKTGDTFIFDLDEKLGDATRVQLPHPEIFAGLKQGTDLLVDDGKIRLTVESLGGAFAQCRVSVGGIISNHKGVNLPGVTLPLSPLTEKDRRDLAYGLEIGVDWIALSFVQRPGDIQEIQEIVKGRAAVMAKLEKPSALDHLEEIVALSDGVMVARGDLGVEMPPERVPGLQKRIIQACRQFGKPVVVATQMLESMISAPTPTRAEASDVASAVYDGADAVMLSAESAAGKYPLEAVTMMARIVAQTESEPMYRSILDAQRHAPEASVSDAISAAARQVAKTLKIAAIVTYTMTGKTSGRISRERPEALIIGLTTLPSAARRMTLYWGVYPVLANDVEYFDEMVSRACRAAARHGFAEPNEMVAITGGVPFGRAGATNLLHIATIRNEHLHG